MGALDGLLGAFMGGTMMNILCAGINIMQMSTYANR